jgi:hypothetical protein
MLAIEAEMLRTARGIIIRPVAPRGQEYTLNGRVLNGQLVADMHSGGWLLDLGNQFAIIEPDSQ